MREWTTDEIIYIIYKHGMVIQPGCEEEFLKHYFTDETIETSGKTRQELAEMFAEMNETILKEIENYYAMDLTILDVIQAEAAQCGMTVEEFVLSIFIREALLN